MSENENLYLCPYQDLYNKALSTTGPNRLNP